jgi:hypothetical protein
MSRSDACGVTAPSNCSLLARVCHHLSLVTLPQPRNINATFWEREISSLLRTTQDPSCSGTMKVPGHAFLPCDGWVVCPHCRKVADREEANITPHWRKHHQCASPYNDVFAVSRAVPREVANALCGKGEEDGEEKKKKEPSKERRFTGYHPRPRTRPANLVEMQQMFTGTDRQPPTWLNDDFLTDHSWPTDGLWPGGPDHEVNSNLAVLGRVPNRRRPKREPGSPRTTATSPRRPRTKSTKRAPEHSPSNTHASDTIRKSKRSKTATEQSSTSHTATNTWNSQNFNTAGDNHPDFNAPPTSTTNSSAPLQPALPPTQGLGRRDIPGVILNENDGPDIARIHLSSTRQLNSDEPEVNQVNSGTSGSSSQPQTHDTHVQSSSVQQQSPSQQSSSEYQPFGTYTTNATSSTQTQEVSVQQNIDSASKKSQGDSNSSEGKKPEKAPKKKQTAAEKALKAKQKREQDEEYARKKKTETIRRGDDEMPSEYKCHKCLQNGQHIEGEFRDMLRHYETLHAEDLNWALVGYSLKETIAGQYDFSRIFTVFGNLRLENEHDTNIARPAHLPCHLCNNKNLRTSGNDVWVPAREYSMHLRNTHQPSEEERSSVYHGIAQRVLAGWLIAINRGDSTYESPDSDGNEVPTQTNNEAQAPQNLDDIQAPQNHYDADGEDEIMRDPMFDEDMYD